MPLSSLSKQSTGPGSPFATELGRRVRDARRARGLSQAALGRPLTRAYVSLIESGHTIPSLPALLHIAQRLGVDPCWLLPSAVAGPIGYTAAHGTDRPLRGAPPS
jgi:transcriptional regulator with XRE-family HTH domain